MKISVTTLFAALLFVAPALAQEDAGGATDSAAPTAPPTKGVPVANPFELPYQSGSGMDSGGMGMGSDMGMYSDMEMGMDSSMGMGMEEMDYGMEPPVSDEKLFRYRLRTAISQISEAENAEEKTALLKYTQSALQEQYDAMIARRTKDLDQLKERLAKLEADLQKRAAAKDRVVKLQMQSVILAAEGLLDLNSLRRF